MQCVMLSGVAAVICHHVVRHDIEWYGIAITSHDLAYLSTTVNSKAR